MNKFLFAAVATCVAYTSGAQVFHMEKSGGGANGFASVRQTTDRNGTTITCVGSGYDKCVYTAPPSQPKLGVVNQAFDYAGTQIKDGVLSGDYTFMDMVISWTGTDINNCAIQVENVPEN